MRKIIAIVAAILVVTAIGVAIFLFLNANKPNSETENTPGPSSTPSESLQVQPDSPAVGEGVKINTVSIVNMTFSPATISVKKGTTVTWTNNDTEPHTVTKVKGHITGPESDTLNPNETYSYTFDEPGIYDYLCTLHTGMTGRVIVTE